MSRSSEAIYPEEVLGRVWEAFKWTLKGGGCGQKEEGSESFGGQETHLKTSPRSFYRLSIIDCAMFYTEVGFFIYSYCTLWYFDKFSVLCTSADAVWISIEIQECQNVWYQVED